MRAYLIAAWVVVCLCSFLTAFAEPAQVNPADVEQVLKALKAPGTTELPRLLRTTEGFLRFIGAPPGGHFVAGVPGATAGSPETVARDFVTTNQGAFGALGMRAGFTTARVNSNPGRTSVRLQQTYGGFQVFGAQMNVQVNGTNGVACVLSDILRDTAALDSGAISLTPSVSMDEAKVAAITAMAAQYEVDADDLVCSDPERMIFDPAVVGAPGTLAFTWVGVVSSIGGSRVAERVFVDAHSGAVVFHYSLICDAKTRRIYDADSQFVMMGTLVRSEGQAPTGIIDADLAYDFFGDTYDFYFETHGRDSIDDAGSPLNGVVRLCVPGACPYSNAFYVPPLGPGEEADPTGLQPNFMYFGEGWAVDDIVAHELTHGVTAFESDLIYAYQSGAINESFSDIWGEYVDLTNGAGNDTDEARWLVGEDTPEGAFRSMSDPPRFGSPDRVNSPWYWTSPFDNGGVHFNSGIGNKLCYLLTDGDEFNGQTVEGIGIERTAQLFYECQTNLLTPASGWEDLYMALGQATVNLGYTFDERLNVKAGGLAVEIAPSSELDALGTFRAIPTFDEFGRPVVVLHWENPASENFLRVILERGTEDFPREPGAGMELYRGREERFLDSAVITGTMYYYTLFVDVREGFPSAAFARAEAGGEPPDYLTESFFTDSLDATVPANPFDLTFSQITFFPTGPPAAPLGSEGYGDHSQYTATIRRNLSQLPVAREDEDGGSYNIPMLDDMMVGLYLEAPFPFFGKVYDHVYLSSNGFVAFDYVYDYDPLNFPSLASHFAMPRISFLFSDLNPNGGGSVWARELDDRVVATFENVPEWQPFVDPPSTAPNTVQVELYYSGRIRITYQGVNAETAVCGLSDGRGVPLDPATVFPNVHSVPLASDLSDLPASLSALTIPPIALQDVESGAEIFFDVFADGPAGIPTPSFSAQWDGPGGVPFADRGDGTAAFRWYTGVDDFGSFTVRVLAQAGDLEAYQDVRLFVDVTSEALPAASRLLLRSNNPIEDPSRNRTVSPNSPLTAEYDYSHPLELMDPELYAEGPTEIHWFRNNQFVRAWSNQHTIPPVATTIGDTWFFTVTPYTLWFLQGMTRQSPIVTVVALPDVLNVALAEDVPAGVTADDLPLEGLPAAAGPAIGGTPVAILGRRLNGPISVTFGGVPASSITAVSDFRLDVLTPAHIPSPVVGGASIPEDVVVTTVAGAGILRQAFAYLGDGASIAKADVNRDGKVNAVDLQLVVNAVLEGSKAATDADVNRDGHVNAADIQVVVNEALD